MGSTPAVVSTQVSQAIAKLAGTKTSLATAISKGRVPSLAQARALLDSASAEWSNSSRAEVTARRNYDMTTSVTQSRLAELWAQRLTATERRKAAMDAYFALSELIKALNAQERAEKSAVAALG